MVSIVVLRTTVIIWDIGSPPQKVDFIDFEKIYFFGRGDPLFQIITVVRRTTIETKSFESHFSETF